MTKKQNFNDNAISLKSAFDSMLSLAKADMLMNTSVMKLVVPLAKYQSIAIDTLTNYVENTDFDEYPLQEPSVKYPRNIMYINAGDDPQHVKEAIKICFELANYNLETIKESKITSLIHAVQDHDKAMCCVREFVGQYGDTLVRINGFNI